MADLHGWQSDPFEIHEQRYFSQGKPTKLVRDDGVESYDLPPAASLPSASEVRARIGASVGQGGGRPRTGTGIHLRHIPTLHPFESGSKWTEPLLRNLVHSVPVPTLHVASLLHGRDRRGREAVRCLE